MCSATACRLIETGFGDKWLINPDSVDKHIAYIEEVRPATGPDASRHVATSRTEKSEEISDPTAIATGTDQSRLVATNPDVSRYVALLESENGFLRGQIAVKDEQIKDLTERAREIFNNKGDRTHQNAGTPRLLRSRRERPRGYPRR